MRVSFLFWVAGIGVLAVLLVAAGLAVRRSRQAAERRRSAEQAALEMARNEAVQAARRKAEKAAAESAARAAAEEAAQQAARHAARQAALEAERLAAAQAQAQAQAAAEAAATPPPPASPRAPEDTLVLVADDSKVVRVKVSRLLAQHRYRVALAEDGAQALQLIEQEVPQVLVTDVEMPQLDGFALTRHVRSHPRAAHIPIVMITAADERLQAAAAEAGVTRVLGKPYDDAALLACIETARLAAR